MFWLKFTETNDYTVPVLLEQNALPVSTSLWIPAFIFLSLSCDCSVYMSVIIPKRKKSFLLQHTSYLELRIDAEMHKSLWRLERQTEQTW